MKWHHTSICLRLEPADSESKSGSPSNVKFKLNNLNLQGLEPWSLNVPAVGTWA